MFVVNNHVPDYTSLLLLSFFVEAVAAALGRRVGVVAVAVVVVVGAGVGVGVGVVVVVAEEVAIALAIAFVVLVATGISVHRALPSEW